LEPKQYLASVWRRWVLVLAGGLAGAVAAAVLSALSPVTYESTAAVYVEVGEVDGTADLVAGSRVGNEVLPTIAQFVQSSAVLQPVVESAGVSVSPGELADALDVVVLEDTAVVEITVAAADPRQATLLAREVGEHIGRAVLSLYPATDGGSLLEVTTIAPPREPSAPASPGPWQHAVLGLLTGLGLGVLASGLADLASPRIRSVEGIAAITDVPVLGVLPVAGPGSAGPDEDGPRRESVGRLVWSVRRTAPSASAGRIGLVGTPSATATLAAELGRAAGLDVVPVQPADDLRATGTETCDGLIVVVRSGRTTRGSLRRTLAVVGRSPAPVLGVVLDGLLPAEAGLRARVTAALRGEAVPGVDRRLGAAGGGAVPAASTRATAVVALVALGLAAPLPLATNTGLVAALVLLPVWITVVPHFCGARALVVLTALGLAAGTLLSVRASADHAFSLREAAEAAVLVLAAVGGIGLLLWARTVLPLWTVGLAYGLGQLTDGLLDAGASVNPYKFELALPLTIILLSLAGARRSPVPAVVSLAALAALDILNDARSAFAFCLAAAGLVLWQHRPARVPIRMGRRRTALVLGGLAIGGYVAIRELLVAGALGAEAQARTITQIRQSGSLLLGGRPEWTATWALARENPLGFGLGTVPNALDVRLAESGFAVTHIPTAEGYLRNYMFGGRFELHSIIADLWSNLGPVGLALGLTMAGLLVWSTVDLISRRQAGPLQSFLVVSALWYLAFGPLPANLPDVALALGLVLLPRRAPSAHTAPVHAAPDATTRAVLTGR
jgi:capsular polysaccharide biosynthesis protein